MHCGAVVGLTTARARGGMFFPTIPRLFTLNKQLVTRARELRRCAFILKSSSGKLPAL